MRKTLTAMLTGALLGAALLGGAQAVGETVTAQRSTQRVYVDGEQVQMEAYAIGGANYVKLRDAGEAVGFNVYWDGSAVQVQSDAPYTGEAPAPRRETGSRIVTLPTDGSKYVPKAGDVIRCDDGYLYEIKDTLRWENNVFSPEPLPELPTPSYDWSVFPTVALPQPEARHFTTNTGEEETDAVHHLRGAEKRAESVARRQAAGENLADHPSGGRAVHQVFLAVA